MIYKLRLRFDYPLALGQVPWWVRLRLVLVHYLLALGFLIHPLALVVGCVIAGFFLLVDTLKKNPHTAENVAFGWQRVAFSGMVGLAFLGLYANNQIQGAHWWWVALVGGGVSFYDGYLVWRGVTGPLYIKMK